MNLGRTAQSTKDLQHWDREQPDENGLQDRDANYETINNDNIEENSKRPERIDFDGTRASCDSRGSQGKLKIRILGNTKQILQNM